MGWRTAVISSPARLSVAREQLQLEILESETFTLPIEDLSALIIEHQQVSLSAPALRKLSEGQVLVLVCDDKHMPSSITLPFATHTRGAEVIALQIGTKESCRKQAWQYLVAAKVRNQQICLKLLCREGHEKMNNLHARIKSNDSGNIEAVAAKIYWPILFSGGFKRSADNQVNSALNYGYAIVRAVIARALCGRGLHPSIGLHHCNKLNGFNLADDLIEPFRPIVDLKVARIFESGATEFNKEVKNELLSLVHQQVLIAEEAVAVSRAADVCSDSLVNALRSGNAQNLDLPRLIP